MPSRTLASARNVCLCLQLFSLSAPVRRAHGFVGKCVLAIRPSPYDTMWHRHTNHVRPRFETSTATAAASVEPFTSGDDAQTWQPAVAMEAPPPAGSQDSTNVAGSAVLKPASAPAPLSVPDASSGHALFRTVIPLRARQRRKRYLGGVRDAVSHRGDTHWGSYT